MTMSTPVLMVVCIDAKGRPPKKDTIQSMYDSARRAASAKGPARAKKTPPTSPTAIAKKPTSMVHGKIGRIKMFGTIEMTEICPM